MEFVFKTKYIFVLFCLFVFCFAENIKAVSNDRFTGLPIPRYVSLKPDKGNVRAGPGLNFPIVWVYKMQNFPFKIIDEYYHWRKIIDFTGEGGWIHKSLLSGKIYGIIYDKDIVNLYDSDDTESDLKAKIAKRNVVEILNCDDDKYCEVKIKEYDGFVLKKYLWGFSK